MRSAAPVRIAIFGNGFARTVVLPCLRHVAGATVTGIASPNLERVRATAAEFGIEHATTDHRELLALGRPHLVFVATPPHRHLEMTVDALAAGCHVVCEKPTALDAAESAAMLAAAARAPGRLALIDHELRFDPRRRALAALVRDGTLGEILHATYTLTSSYRQDPARPWTWWSDRAQGGGAWGAIGSHAVDTLRVYLGEVAAARGHLATAIPERRDPASGALRPVTSDDRAAAWLRFPSGTATITISLVESERRHEFGLTGTKGAARWIEQRPLLVSAGGASVWREVQVDDDLPDSATLGIPETDWARSFVRYATAIVAALGAGKSVVDGAATFGDGHRNQEVLDAVRQSAAEEAWVQITNHGEQLPSGGIKR
jgi:predicted dehydrogenase